MNGYTDERGSETTNDGAAQQLVFTLNYGYVRPPLTANQRLHWRTKARLTKDIRDTTKFLAHRIPDLGRCAVTLTWFVTDRRRRDVDNIVPTLKAMCDGLVDAGIVRDDTPDLMVKAMPTIIHSPKPAVPHFELIVTEIRA